MFINNQDIADLAYASHLAYRIGSPIIVAATVLQWLGLPARLVPAARFATAFGFVFLGFSVLFWAVQHLPRTFLDQLLG
jgi:hypothetical protein